MKLPEQSASAGDPQDAVSDEEVSLLLKVLALTDRQVAAGKVRPAAEAFAEIRRRLLPPLRANPYF